MRNKRKDVKDKERNEGRNRINIKKEGRKEIGMIKRK